MDSWSCIPEASFSGDESHCIQSDVDDDVGGIDVSALFAAVPLSQVDLPLATQPKPRLHGEADDATPRNLSHAALLKEALIVSGTRRNLPRRVRRRGKFDFDARVLEQLATDPSLVRRTRPMPRQLNKTGYHEFRRWYIAFSGLPWRDGEQRHIST